MPNVDVIVVGSGIAGCAAALAAAECGGRVALLTKQPDLNETNTWHAQGGIIFSGNEDSTDLLVQDILAAGAGISSRAAAEMLSIEGPQRVRDLLLDRARTRFDSDSRGNLHFTLEGAHSVPRVIHSKDYTGRTIQEQLSLTVARESNIRRYTNADVVDLVVTDGRCAGVVVSINGMLTRFSARAVVLATGGLGALYEHTTNPSFATGDGVALALRAGAEVRNMNYVQFHPTAMLAPDGSRFLISESLRGEGAVLRDAEGNKFIRHPQGSLAPRDVVAREIWHMMHRTGSPCAWLHIPARSREWFAERFPTIYSRCRDAGINAPSDPIPVVPAAHYSCGGVVTDEDGRTTVRGLFAAGEVACTGLHGANRLASTSLLEGLVWGWRAGKRASRPAVVRPTTPSRARGCVFDPAVERPNLDQMWVRLRETMWRYAGLARSKDGLQAALQQLGDLQKKAATACCLEGWQLGLALTTAHAIVESALADTESRGCHYRIDEEQEIDGDYISGQQRDHATR